MSMVEFNAVSKNFGATQVLHNINLKIESGEVVMIIGPSGSGKSTLLRCINKLEEISSGTLLVAGMHITDPHANECDIRREAGMVFQQFHLFPHLTALENVMFGPIRVRHQTKAAAREQALALLERVGLRGPATPHPSLLFGGRCGGGVAGAIAPATIRLNFQGVSSSAWRLPGHWPSGRK